MLKKKDPEYISIPAVCVYLCALEYEKFGQCAVKGVYEKHPFLSFFHLASRHQNSFVKYVEYTVADYVPPVFPFAVIMTICVSFTTPFRAEPGLLTGRA